MDQLGIRELRADLAAHVKRAGAGTTAVITINGRPAAMLAPIEASSSGDRDLAALVTGGALIPPRRSDGKPAEGAVQVWGNVRLDRLLREVRG